MVARCRWWSEADEVVLTSIVTINGVPSDNGAKTAIYRKLTNSVPSQGGQGLSSGAARPVCDSEFAGQFGQMLVRCPERRVGDKGGSEQMRIDPPNASAVQLV